MKNKNMNKTEIIKAYSSAGYSIDINGKTVVKEPFKSVIDGKVIWIEQAFSSKEKDFNFLEKCLKDFNLTI